MAALAPALCTLSGSLTHLGLQHCGLDAEGVAAALAPALQHLTSLTHLDLHCGLSVEGVAAGLAPALQNLTFLTHLDISNNRLAAPSYGALAQALAPLHSLRHLNLQGNAIKSNKVAATLAAALLAPMSLTFLAVTVHDEMDTGQGCFSTLAPRLLKQAA